jgi:hypothetical protein
MTNRAKRDRIEAARAALAAWRASKGYGPGEETDEADARDLIADLLHLVYAGGGIVEVEAALAMSHYRAEGGKG